MLKGTIFGHVSASPYREQWSYRGDFSENDYLAIEEMLERVVRPEARECIELTKVAHFSSFVDAGLYTAILKSVPCMSGWETVRVEAYDLHTFLKKLRLLVVVSHQ